MACIRTTLALEFGVGEFYGYLHDAGCTSVSTPSAAC